MSFPSPRSPMVLFLAFCAEGLGLQGKTPGAVKQRVGFHIPLYYHPIPSPPLDQCKLGNLGNCYHCLVSPRQPQNPEFIHRGNIATGVVNRSWEIKRFGWFCSTQNPEASQTVLPWPFPGQSATHISANLAFQPPLVT